MTSALMMIAAAVVTPVALPAAELPKALIEPYLAVQGALAADRVDGVGEQAKAIEAAAATLGGGADKVVAGARQLQAARDIAAARTAFGELSDALVAYADKTKAELPPDTRIAFCPMANKSWLQTEQEIRNPYYGAAMLTCGSFREKD